MVSVDRRVLRLAVNILRKRCNIYRRQSLCIYRMPKRKSTEEHQTRASTHEREMLLVEVAHANIQYNMCFGIPTNDIHILRQAEKMETPQIKDLLKSIKTEYESRNV